MQHGRTILGIDPGLATVGYAFLLQDIRHGGLNQHLRILDFGVIKTDPAMPFPERLLQIQDDLSMLMDRFAPSEAVVEELFFSTNEKTALSVAQARGVLLVTLASKKLLIRTITPNQVKQAVTGDGRADKVQVQDMLRMIFSLEMLPKPDDAADALAIAYAGSFL